MVHRAKARRDQRLRPRFLKRMQEQSESAYQSEAVYRSVVDYARAYKNRKQQPHWVAERLIDALNAQKQGINAVTHFNEQYIRLQAEESTQRLQRGEARSLLEGVPISVKDELDAVPHCTSVAPKSTARMVPARMTPPWWRDCGLPVASSSVRPICMKSAST